VVATDEGFELEFGSFGSANAADDEAIETAAAADAAAGVSDFSYSSASASLSAATPSSKSESVSCCRKCTVVSLREAFLDK
jgi:hypothetical protein